MAGKTAIKKVVQMENYSVVKKVRTKDEAKVVAMEKKRGSKLVASKALRKEDSKAEKSDLL
jgi:hypothetical protein